MALTAKHEQGNSEMVSHVLYIKVQSSVHVYGMMLFVGKKPNGNFNELLIVRCLVLHVFYIILGFDYYQKFLGMVSNQQQFFHFSLIKNFIFP